MTMQAAMKGSESSRKDERQCRADGDGDKDVAASESTDSLPNKVEMIQTHPV